MNERSCLSEPGVLLSLVLNEFHKLHLNLFRLNACVCHSSTPWLSSFWATASLVSSRSVTRPWSSAASINMVRIIRKRVIILARFFSWNCYARETSWLSPIHECVALRIILTSRMWILFLTGRSAGLKYDDILVETDPDVQLATSRLSPELVMQRWVFLWRS